MEQIKAKILAHLIKNDGTVKDFSRAMQEVEIWKKSVGEYPSSLVIKNEIIDL